MVYVFVSDIHLPETTFVSFCCPSDKSYEFFVAVNSDLKLFTLEIMMFVTSS